MPNGGGVHDGLPVPGGQRTQDRARSWVGAGMYLPGVFRAVGSLEDGAAAIVAPRPHFSACPKRTTGQ